jgi:hypothetical protein
MRYRRLPSRNPRATTLQIWPSASIRPILERQQEAVPGDLMTDRVEQQKPECPKNSSWWWPGVVASGLAGAAVLAFRGCWHRKMSCPIGGQGYSYQVCLSCGAKRLFDEKNFSAHGPFRYDLNQLTAWEGPRNRTPIPWQTRRSPQPHKSALLSPQVHTSCFTVHSTL